MEKGQTLILLGTTQTPYIFTVYPWNDPLVSVGAVYIVLRRNEAGYSIIYIGRTSVLSLDLLTHPLMPEFDQAGKTHIGVHIEPVLSKRYTKQMDLVVNFTPMLNM